MIVLIALADEIRRLGVARLLFRAPPWGSRWAGSSERGAGWRAGWVVRVTHMRDMAGFQLLFL
jgi:hypothetical protein